MASTGVQEEAAYPGTRHARRGSTPRRWTQPITMFATSAIAIITGAAVTAVLKFIVTALPLGCSPERIAFSDLAACFDATGYLRPIAAMPARKRGGNPARDHQLTIHRKSDP